MAKIGHRKVGYLDDKQNFVPLIWIDSQTCVYFDDLSKLIAEQDAQISAFARKCAPIRKPKKFNARQIVHMKRLRADGASLRYIAKEMGCAESTVRNYLKNDSSK